MSGWVYVKIQNWDIPVVRAQHKPSSALTRSLRLLPPLPDLRCLLMLAGLSVLLCYQKRETGLRINLEIWAVSWPPFSSLRKFPGNQGSVFSWGSRKCLREPRLEISAQRYPTLPKNPWHHQFEAIGNEKGPNSTAWPPHLGWIQSTMRMSILMRSLLWAAAL